MLLPHLYLWFHHYGEQEYRISLLSLTQFFGKTRIGFFAGKWHSMVENDIGWWKLSICREGIPKKMVWPSHDLCAMSRNRGRVTWFLWDSIEQKSCHPDMISVQFICTEIMSPSHNFWPVHNADCKSCETGMISVECVDNHKSCQSHTIYLYTTKTGHFCK